MYYFHAEVLGGFYILALKMASVPSIADSECPFDSIYDAFLISEAFALSGTNSIAVGISLSMVKMAGFVAKAFLDGNEASC